MVFTPYRSVEFWPSFVQKNEEKHLFCTKSIASTCLHVHMIRKIYKINATVVYFLKVWSDFDLFEYALSVLLFQVWHYFRCITELFNKLLIISINKLFFLHIHKDSSISSTQRGHFFNISSETCLSKKLQSHGLCKFCSFPEPWVGFSKSLGGIFHNPGWRFPASPLPRPYRQYD